MCLVRGGIFGVGFSFGVGLGLVFFCCFFLPLVCFWGIFLLGFLVLFFGGFGFLSCGFLGSWVLGS